MPISIVVLSAETLTFLLTVALCVRIFILYRASEPRKRPPDSLPMALPKPQPNPSQTAPELLESYIGELLGTHALEAPYRESPAPGMPSRQAHPRQASAAAMEPESISQPLDSQTCQSIAHFLLSRRYDTESV